MKNVSSVNMRESVIKYEIVEFKKLDKNIYKKSNIANKLTENEIFAI